MALVLSVLAAAACNTPRSKPVTGHAETVPGAGRRETVSVPEPGETMQTLAFTPLGQEDRVPAILTGLELTLAVEPMQAADAGLAFSVSVKNASAGAISLHNPYDVLTYQLANGGGLPIATRSPPSRIKTGRFVDRSSYLRVRGIRIDGAAVADLDAQLKTDALTIDAGTTLTYDLAIEQVAPPKDADWPTTIVAGEYTLSCLVSLIALTPSDPPGATMSSGDVHVVVK